MGGDPPFIISLNPPTTVPLDLQAVLLLLWLDFLGASEGIEAYIVWCTTSDVLGAAMKPTTNALHATTVPLDLRTVLRPPMDAAAMFHLTRRGCRISLQNCTLGFTRGNAVAEKSRPMSRVFDVLTSGPYFTTLRSCRSWRFTFCQRCSTRRSRLHRCRSTPPAPHPQAAPSHALRMDVQAT